MRIVWTLILTGAVFSGAFYLPGVAPRDYQEFEAVELKVNDLESVKTQIPYEFYALPFCKPDKIEAVSENLGQILSGEDIENSKYEILMRGDQKCKILCRVATTKDNMLLLSKSIEMDYKINLIVDNLPAATKYYTSTIPDPVKDEDYTEHYDKGFPLGQWKDGKAILNNHHKIILFYHSDPSYSGASHPVSTLKTLQYF